MKNSKIDFRFLIPIILYAVIIGIAWGISRNSIDTNKSDIKINTVDIKELQVKSVKSEVDLKGLSVRMEYMIDLQKEMNETLKTIKK